MILIELLGISPISQIIRRYIANGKDVKFLSGKSEEQMINALEEYINLQSNLKGKNIDRVYDSISADEIDIILKTLEKDIEGKEGFYDCMQDDNVRISMEKEITKIVKESVLDKKNERGEQK